MKPKFNYGKLAGYCAALLLAGCTNSAGPATAVEPGPDTACSLDGMMLADFPGPKAQIVYSEGPPEFFCDLMELFGALHEPEQKRGVAALFVQDMGKTSWDRPVGNWIDARAALYVVGSRKQGSMGSTFASFSSREDADAFVRAEGGRVVKFGQVTPDMLMMDSAAGNDSAGH